MLFVFRLILCCSAVCSFLAYPVMGQSDQSPQGSAWKLHVIDNSSQGADGVKLGDFNGDGRPDIVTGWEEGGLVRAYLHPGKAKVKSPWPQMSPGIAKDVEDAAWIDLNQDGHLDVVSSSEGQTMKLQFHLRPVKEGGAWSSYDLNSAPKTRWMFAWPLDIDRSHGIDLVAGSKNPKGVIGWFQAPKYPKAIQDWKWYPLAKSTWIMSIWFEDVDGDGDQDIIYSDRRGKTRGIHWLKRPEDPTKPWTRHTVWTEKQKKENKRNSNDIMSMAPCDLDGDGLTDYTVALQDYRILVLRRVKADTPTWESHFIPVAGKVGNTRAVQAGDLDGDGDLDLAVTTWNAEDLHGVFWMENDGSPLDGGWTMRTVSGAEKGIKYDRIELLDIDEDGDLDLLTCEEHEANGGLGVIWYENPSR